MSRARNVFDRVLTRDAPLAPLRERARAAVRVLAEAPRARGIVPIPALRAAFPRVFSDILDEVLFEGERAQWWDLKIANDPRGVPSPELGIRVPDRGLVYFILPR